MVLRPTWNRELNSDLCNLKGIPFLESVLKRVLKTVKEPKATVKED